MCVFLPIGQSIAVVIAGGVLVHVAEIVDFNGVRPIVVVRVFQYDRRRRLGPCPGIDVGSRNGSGVIVVVGVEHTPNAPMQLLIGRHWPGQQRPYVSRRSHAHRLACCREVRVGADLPIIGAGLLLRIPSKTNGGSSRFDRLRAVAPQRTPQKLKPLLVPCSCHFGLVVRVLVVAGVTRPLDQMRIGIRHDDP